MKYSEFSKLMENESVLASMRGIGKIHIPTLITEVGKFNDKYWHCYFNLNTNGAYLNYDDHELLSSMYLMDVLGAKLVEMFDPNNIDYNYVRPNPFDENGIRYLATKIIKLYPIYEGIKKGYIEEIGKIQFNWYTYDTKIIKFKNITDEIKSELVFTVNDFMNEDQLKYINIEVKNAIDILASHVGKLSLHENISDIDIKCIYAELVNLKQGLVNAESITVRKLSEICEEYVSKKAEIAMGLVLDEEDKVTVLANSYEIKIHLEREIRDYIGSMVNQIRSAIDLRENNVSVLISHLN